MPKIYYREKTTSSTNVAGKSDYLSVRNSNWIHVYHPVLVLTQNESRTLISDWKHISTGKSRKLWNKYVETRTSLTELQHLSN
jgi:hypothetical protein